MKKILVGMFAVMVFSTISRGDVGYSYFEDFESYSVGTNMTTYGWFYSAPAGDRSGFVSDMLVDQGQSLYWTTNSTSRNVLGRYIPAANRTLPNNATAVATCVYKGSGNFVFQVSGTGVVNGTLKAYGVGLTHSYSPDGSTGNIKMSDALANLYLLGSPTRNINQGILRLVATNTEVHGYWKANWSDNWQEISYNGSGGFAANGYSGKGFETIMYMPYMGCVQETGSNAGTMGVDTVSFNIQSGPVIDFAPDAGTYLGAQTVRVNTIPVGGTIYYTLDNTTPTTESPSIADNGTISVEQSSTLKVLATIPGWTASATKTAEYTIIPTAATPTFTPDGGLYGLNQAVTISSSTPGATIYYTLDNTTPTTSSPLYFTSPGRVLVDHSLTLKAFAAAEGYHDSAVKSADYQLPDSFSNRLKTIPYIQHIAIDGDLTKAAWADAEWAPLDQVYWMAIGFVDSQVNAEMPEAYVAYKWGDKGTKLYVAVRVRDMHHVLGELWNNGAYDSIEAFIHTNGPGSANYSASEEDAQHYEIGIMGSNPNGTWANIGNNPLVPPVFANFQAAGKIEGEWLNYELAITPFQHFSLDGNGLIPNTLVAGDVIGLDVTAGCADEYGLWGMKAENLLKWKSQSYLTFARHALAGLPGDANGDSMVDVGDLGILAANYGGSVKTWAQGDFNGDGLVDVGDLGILAAHYGEGVDGTSDFAADYAKAFGSTVEDDDSETLEGSSLCGGLGLPLIAGLLLAGLCFMVRMEE